MRKQDAIYTLPMILKQADLRRVWCRGRKTITPSQRVWTRYMLSLWGKHLGGDDAPAGCVNVIGRLMIRSEWSHDQAERIINVVKDLYSRGYRGEELFNVARGIVLPGASINGIFASFSETEDAAFVESVMHKEIKRDSPIRSIAIKRYCDRRTVQNIAQDINYHTGFDIQAARKRVTWCEEILEEELFFAMKRLLEVEVTHN
ncbi:hypothetical protein [Serratia sp. M24T3]|uniref:hypothetical protein n=1 Tax=Serratia sp. M24T3 TaxID=932213 RepID=UPI00025BBA79|nr:hypothetical protein [Serratia sp. M24T3]EIC83380.1 hypothetical protein SPM24T3_17255 [Serratia sp. M24T3]